MTLSCNYVEFHQPASGCETRKVCVSSAHQKSGVGRGSLAFALLFSAFCTFLLFFTPFATPSTAPLHNPFLLPLAGTSSSLSLPYISSPFPHPSFNSHRSFCIHSPHHLTPSSHSLHALLSPLHLLSLTSFSLQSLLFSSIHFTPLHSTPLLSLTTLTSPYNHHHQPSTQLPNRKEQKMASLKKLQRYFFAFITVYMVTGIGALIMGSIWLRQSADGAPREAVISRAIEQSKFIFLSSPLSLFHTSLFLLLSFTTKEQGLRMEQ